MTFFVSACVYVLMGTCVSLSSDACLWQRSRCHEFPPSRSVLSTSLRSRQSKIHRAPRFWARIALGVQSSVSSCQVGLKCRPGELGDDPVRGWHGRDVQWRTDVWSYKISISKYPFNLYQYISSNMIVIYVISRVTHIPWTASDSALMVIGWWLAMMLVFLKYVKLLIAVFFTVRIACKVLCISYSALILLVGHGSERAAKAVSKHCLFSWGTPRYSDRHCSDRRYSDSPQLGRWVADCSWIGLWAVPIGKTLTLFVTLTLYIPTYA